ncbi:MAG: Uma2 family endonuclease [Hormoscilla sp. GUM202]|nr:Uma2 family endonuclease [Hormoscilla sp. GUM202]
MSLTIPKQEKVILSNVSWQEFEHLLAEMGDTRAARIAYDRGIVEIIKPLPEHEYFKEAIGDLVKDLAEELELDYESLGSTTWKRQDLLAGVEPDNCFYIQNESLIRGRLDIDLSQDPPPDLALEIDITSKSLNRQPIYARLGVPEIWCYDRGVLKIYHLQGGTYLEDNTSLAFPNFPVKSIPSFIRENLSAGRRRIRKLFREWVKRVA